MEGTRLVAVRSMFSLSATRELYNLSLARGDSEYADQQNDHCSSRRARRTHKIGKTVTRRLRDIGRR